MTALPEYGTTSRKFNWHLVKYWLERLLTTLFVVVMSSFFILVSIFAFVWVVCMSAIFPTQRPNLADSSAGPSADPPMDPPMDPSTDLSTDPSIDPSMV